MTDNTEQSVVDFHMYPPIGSDDWRYAFQTAAVRALEPKMLSKAVLLDIANASSFEDAVELLVGGEYAMPQGGKNFAEVENVLQVQRSAIRGLFSDLMIDEPIVKLFKARDDFANIRLALGRTLTGKPLGTDYSRDGNVAQELFEEIFEQENYGNLPDYMSEAVERAVLSYYQKKNIRRIDYEIDAVQAEYNISKAQELKSLFLLGLFRTQIDLTNIRTLLRLKYTESQSSGKTAGDEAFLVLDNVFSKGGYVESEQLKHGLDIGYEAAVAMFFSTPYYRVIETGTNYLVSDKSFLKLEQQCEEHLAGYLMTTVQITAGPQPIVAYLLMIELEIRRVRLVLTAQKNSLDTKLILDRIS